MEVDNNNLNKALSHLKESVTIFDLIVSLIPFEQVDSSVAAEYLFRFYFYYNIIYYYYSLQLFAGVTCDVDRQRGIILWDKTVIIIIIYNQNNTYIIEMMIIIIIVIICYIQ